MRCGGGENNTKSTAKLSHIWEFALGAIQNYPFKVNLVENLANRYDQRRTPRAR
jgi:hypothetical protein